MGKFEGASSGCFPTTQWTQIIKVMQGDDDLAAANALAEFCRQYRPAIYNFFLRRSCSPENAGDLTQEFFLSKIVAPWSERRSFLHQAKWGENLRFRSFLSSVLWHFLRDQYDRGGRRGGRKVQHVPLDDWLPREEGDVEKAFARFGREFDRVFALEIIQKAAARSKQSRHLEAHLRGEISQSAAAAELGISEGAFKLAYHRFRKRLAENLWGEVAKLAGPDENEIRAEIRHLMSLFAGPAP